MNSNLLFLTLALSTPLILAAMGGFTSERGGVINIGLEGLMLVSACTVALVTPSSGPIVALLCGIGASIALSMLHWLATQVYRVDHVISGMAINAVAAGGTEFFLGKFQDVGSPTIRHLPVALYESLAILFPIALFVYSRSFRGGIWLRAAGSDPAKARLAGLSPIRIRLFGLIATGLFSGLGGAMLVSYTETFTNGMTAGRGYIALAALILGGWRPLPTLAACLVFGLFSALQVQLQGQSVFGVQPPSQVWSSLPYLVTVFALAGFWGKNRTPRGLGKI